MSEVNIFVSLEIFFCWISYGHCSCTAQFISLWTYVLHIQNNTQQVFVLQTSGSEIRQPMTHFTKSYKTEKKNADVSQGISLKYSYVTSPTGEKEQFHRSKCQGQEKT